MNETEDKKEEKKDVYIGAGIDPTTVSGVLGHSQVSATLNLYSHMFLENKIKACDAVANALDFSKKKESAVS